MNTDLINYSYLRRKYGESPQLNAEEIWNEICRRFGITLVMANASGLIEKVVLDDDFCCPHFLPILCIVRSERYSLIVYYAWSDKELLSTFALFPHHNFLPRSQVVV